VTDGDPGGTGGISVTPLLTLEEYYYLRTVLTLKLTFHRDTRHSRIRFSIPPFRGPLVLLLQGPCRLNRLRHLLCVEDKRPLCQLSSKRLEDNWHGGLLSSTLRLDHYQPEAPAKLTMPLFCTRNARHSRVRFSLPTFWRPLGRPY